MTTTIKGVVTYLGKRTEEQNFYNVMLGGDLSFIINENDPYLNKFVKGYILTVEVAAVIGNVQVPKDEPVRKGIIKSIASFIAWAKGAKCYVNLKGVKIVGIEKPSVVMDDVLASLPDVANIVQSVPVGGHLRSVGRV